MKSDYQFLVSVTIDGKMLVKVTDEDTASENVSNYIMSKFPDSNISDIKIERFHNLKGNINE